ncbi:TetR/AcrR family transcriptional regulator [Thermophagus sp. OGC60D27]|uniref:TetR/AcrR family transcriptional regulator n=1 Tax=Thermophagus sp. OGC60D27 TaxID=3458415 RepID=UPI004037A42F
MKEIKRERILKEALTLFATKGFHATTIEAIAKAAGVAKGSVYNYFESKEAIIRAVVFDTILEAVDWMDPNHDGVITEGEFFEMIRKSKKWLVENREFLILYYSTVTHPKVNKLLENELWQILEPHMKKAEDFFIHHGFGNPIAEVRFFFAMLDGISVNYVVDPHNFPLDHAVDRLIKYYKGLLKDDALNR